MKKAKAQTQSKKGYTTNQDPTKVVKPFLSHRGDDLRRRLQNRSIIKREIGSHNYNLDPSIEATRRMSKGDLILAARKNQANIDQARTELKKQGTAPKPGNHGA